MWEKLILSFMCLKDDLYVNVLAMLILLDIFTGTAKALKTKKVNSTIGINGLVRHVLVFVLVLVISTFLPVMDLDGYRQLLIVWFVVMYLSSLIENLGEIGIPLPSWVVERVYKLQGRYEEDEVSVKDIKSFKIDKKD